MHKLASHQDILWYATCKLEYQESQWYNSVQFQRTGCWMDILTEKNPFSFPLFYLCLTWIGPCSPILVRENIFFLSFFRDIYLFIWGVELHREGERSHSPVDHMAGAGQGWSRALELHPDLPCECRGPSTCVIFHCFPVLFRRELNHKCCIQDSNQHSFGMPAL